MTRRCKSEAEFSDGIRDGKCRISAGVSLATLDSMASRVATLGHSCTNRITTDLSTLFLGGNDV